MKIEIRADCKVCGATITNKRSRTYCSPECRNKTYAQRYKESRTNWQRAKRDKEAMIPSPDKVQCQICKKYYVQVCSHIYLVHGMEARDYKKKYGLDIKRGNVPKWYRKEKGEITLENKTYRNLLETGKKFWFKKGDKTIGRYKRSPQTMERLKQRSFIKKDNK
jgi:predicted nucleic acid-binding Zn ribbon protein